MARCSEANVSEARGLRSKYARLLWQCAAKQMCTSEANVSEARGAAKQEMYSLLY